MKSIGSFIIILVILCVCFAKCTSDETKIKVYRITDTFINNQIEKCEQHIVEKDTL